eukprot:450794_1
MSTDEVPHTDLRWEYLCYAGGFTLSICLMPQLIKALRTKRTNDISFGWQAMYIFGLAASMPYAYIMQVYPVAIPITLELILCIILAVIKFKFDVIDNLIKSPLDTNETSPLLNDHDESYIQDDYNMDIPT